MPSKRVDASDEQKHPVHLRWWYDSLGRNQFTTLHVSRYGASRFMKQKTRGGWRSRPSKRTITKMVTFQEFEAICDAIADGDGVKYSL